MTRRKTRRMTGTKLVCLTAIVLAASTIGCGPRQLPGLSGEIAFDLRAANNPSPFGASPVASFEIALFEEDIADAEVLTLRYQESTGQLSGGEDPLQLFEAGTQVRAELRGLGVNTQSVQAFGRSLPFVMPAAGVRRVPVLLAVPDTVSVLQAGPLTARHDGLALRISEAEILLVGGKATVASIAPALYDHNAGVLSPVTISSEDQSTLNVAFPSGCAFDDGRVVVAGGIIDHDTSTYSAAVFVVEGDSVRRLDDLPSPRAGMHAACFDDDNIAVFAGGLIADVPFVVDDIVEISLDTETAVVAADRITLARGFSSGVDLQQADAEVSMMTGGLTVVDGAFVPSLAVDFIERQSGRTRRFEAQTGNSAAALTNLVEPRFGHTVVAIGASALIYGGANMEGPLADPAPLWFSPEFSSPGAFLPAIQSTIVDLPPRVGAAGTFLSGTNTALLFGGSEGGALLEIQTTPGLNISALNQVPITGLLTAANRGHRYGQAFAMADGTAIVVGGRSTTESTMPTEVARASDAIDVLVPCTIANACNR